MQIDRPLVHQDLRGEQVDLPEHSRPVRGRVDDHDVLRRRAAERHLRRREVLGAPVPPPVVGLANVARFGDEREELVGCGRPEHLARLERQLERRAPQMSDQDVEVVGIETRLLGASLEEELRMMDDVAVNGRAGRDEDADARLATTPGPADLLPRRRDRARVTGQDRHVESADVDPELERVRRDDAEDLAVAKAALDRSPLEGQVAAAIAADPRSWTQVLTERFAQRRQHDLDGRSASPEHDRLSAGPEERHRPTMRDRHRRSASAGGTVRQRWLDEEHVALAARSAVLVDQDGGSSGEGRGELQRIRNRRRAADDDRMAAVVRTQPEQSSDHVRDMAAEDAAVRVQLVDHDHPELLEQLEPLGVVGEDRRVEHVGVRDDDLSGTADRRPNRRRRIAVVRRRGDGQPCGP